MRVGTGTIGPTDLVQQTMVAYMLFAVAAPPDALHSLITRLETLHQVSFTYRRVLDYKETKYHNDMSWQIVAKMNPDGTPPFGQFSADNKQIGPSGYDGKTYWHVDSKTQVPRLTLQPKADYFDSVSYLRNNIFGLSKSLKAAVKAKPGCIQEAKDSEGLTVLNWDCGMARPTISVPLELMQVPTRFRLEIDKKTWLPKRIVQYLEHQGDTIVTEFSDWNLKPKLPAKPFSPPLAGSQANPRVGARADPKMPEIGSLAPAVPASKALKGTPLTKFEPGQVYVLEFWATWCAPCREAIPHMNDLTKRFAGQPVEFFSVTGESAPQLVKFLAKYPIETNILCDAQGLQSAFAIQVIPRTVLIDKQGRVAAITSPQLVTEDVLKAMVRGEKINLETKSNQRASLDWDEGLSTASLAHVIVQPSDSAGGGQKVPPGSGRITMDGAVIQNLVQLANSASYFDTQWNAGEADNVRYRVSVKAPDKSDTTARTMLNEVIGKMFGLNTEWRDVEREVYVMRTNGPTKLPLSAGPSNDGFARAGEIKWPYAGAKDIANIVRDFGIYQTVVDETGLAGHYELHLTWTSGDSADLIKALAVLGLSLTKETRKVPTFVVSKRG